MTRPSKDCTTGLVPYVKKSAKFCYVQVHALEQFHRRYRNLSRAFQSTTCPPHLQFASYATDLFILTFLVG